MKKLKKTNTFKISSKITNKKESKDSAMNNIKLLELKTDKNIKEEVNDLNNNLILNSVKKGHNVIKDESMTDSTVAVSTGKNIKHKKLHTNPLLLKIKKFEINPKITQKKSPLKTEININCTPIKRPNKSKNKIIKKEKSVSNINIRNTEGKSKGKNNLLENISSLLVKKKIMPQILSRNKSQINVNKTQIVPFKLPYLCKINISKSPLNGNKKEIKIKEKNNKMDVLYEMESKATILQRGVRKLFAKKRLKNSINKTNIEDNSLQKDTSNNITENNQNEIIISLNKNFTFNNESDSSKSKKNSKDSKSRNNSPKNNINLLYCENKNKSQNILNSSSNSVISIISKESVNSSEINNFEFEDDISNLNEDNYFADS